MLTKTSLLAQSPFLHEVVAVSKTFGLDDIRRVMALGYTHFGENKAQELKLKAQAGLPVTWHFIGHLQTNKVKDVVRDASWIQSVDSLKLVDALDHETQKQSKPMSVLIQVNLAKESTKGGCTEAEVEGLIQAILKTPFLDLKGFMVIGPLTQDDEWTKQVFQKAQDLHQTWQTKYPQLTELSMGMSHDYPLALTYGSTMIRIGSILFGQRQKTL